jgi:hypothetical protein
MPYVEHFCDMALMLHNTDLGAGVYKIHQSAASAQVQFRAHLTPQRMRRLFIYLLVLVMYRTPNKSRIDK